MVTEQHIEIEAPDEPPPARCKKCKMPFDPTDRSFDGAAQHYDSGFCRRCVDRCHEATELGHVCEVCAIDDGVPADLVAKIEEDDWANWQADEQRAAADVECDYDPES